MRPYRSLPLSIRSRFCSSLIERDGLTHRPMRAGIFRARNLRPETAVYCGESNERRRTHVKVLITSAAAGLSRQLASSLGDDHEILLTDREDVSTGFPFVRSDLNHTAPNERPGSRRRCHRPLRRGRSECQRFGPTGLPDALHVQPAEGGVGRRRAPPRIPQFAAAHGRVRPVVRGYRTLETDAHVRTAGPLLSPWRDRVQGVRTGAED